MDIRDLVLSHKYQVLLKSKDLNLRLFKNEFDLNKSQIEFLYWADIYNRLFEILATKRFKNLTEKVILNKTRCDAFMVWLNKQVEEDSKMEELKDQLKLPKSSKDKPLDYENAFSFDFTRKK
jgi:hypothetical protein